MQPLPEQRGANRQPVAELGQTGMVLSRVGLGTWAQGGGYIKTITFPQWIELHTIPVMTTPLADSNPQTLHAATIGTAWLAAAGRIIADGIATRYDDLPVREISLVTLAIDRPDPGDEVIACYGEPARLAWMHANFTSRSPIAALGDADSYATRLFDYEHSGRDQVAWVIDRLRRDPATRSAVITTLQPRTDTAYIPCLSLLDFWLPRGAVELIAYAHSIDFGAKGYANLAELASLQHHVAGQLGRTAGRLLMTVKSAHIYHSELPYMHGVLADHDRASPR